VNDWLIYCDVVMAVDLMDFAGVARFLIKVGVRKVWAWRFMKAAAGVWIDGVHLT